MVVEYRDALFVTDTLTNESGSTETDETEAFWMPYYTKAKETEVFEIQTFHVYIWHLIVLGLILIILIIAISCCCCRRKKEDYRKERIVEKFGDSDDEMKVEP